VDRHCWAVCRYIDSRSFGSKDGERGIVLQWDRGLNGNVEDVRMEER